MIWSVAILCSLGGMTFGYCFGWCDGEKFRSDCSVTWKDTTDGIRPD